MNVGEEQERAVIGICAGDEIRVRYPEEDASTLALTLGCSRIFAVYSRCAAWGVLRRLGRTSSGPSARFGGIFLGNEDPGGEGLRAALREGCGSSSMGTTMSMVLLPRRSRVELCL
jgi:hypothetical protein